MRVLLSAEPVRGSDSVGDRIVPCSRSSFSCTVRPWVPRPGTPSPNAWWRRDTGHGCRPSCAWAPALRPWPRVVGAVRDDHREVPVDSPLVLVVHSNAGLFLPAIRSGRDHAVTASVFFDAALPARIGPAPVAPPRLLEFLRPKAVDGRLPRWTDWWDEADVAPMFSVPQVRQKVVEEQPNLPVSYYEQHIPVPADWDDHPCSYVLLGPPYDGLADEARQRGRGVAHLPGAHLHQIVDPAGTARHLVDLSAH